MVCSENDLFNLIAIYAVYIKAIIVFYENSSDVRIINKFVKFEPSNRTILLVLFVAR